MKNPRTIEVLKENETETVDGVDSWWYDDLDLIVRYMSGETERFPAATVN